MARTGSLLTVILWASTALAEVELSMSADRTKVGTEDTFRVEISVTNAPQGAVLQLPTSNDFEILGRSESTQMSFSTGPGGAGVITAVRTHALTVRANRTGKLLIPPAVLKAQGKEWRTGSVTLEVVPGRLAPARPTRPRQVDPFGFPGLPFPDDPFEEPDIPTSDSDLFMRASLDRSEVVVGEQLTYSLYIYSRLDLSSVDAVKPPKLDGFFSADLKVPNTLMPEQRVINGVPYRQYLLRTRALFPLKPGSITIEPAEADITTGIFFAGRRVNRKSNPLTVKVKPLPPGGRGQLVGQWRLSREVRQPEVTLGEPLQLRVKVEGRGNLQALEPPRLEAPDAFKVFEPETKDTSDVKGNSLTGSRTMEFTLIPQRTGTFTLPAMQLDYFDPAQGQWTVSRVDAVEITVKPSSSAPAPSAGAPTASEPQAKNQLVSSGLRPLRVRATFASFDRPLSRSVWFMVMALAPLLLTVAWVGGSALKGALSARSPEAVKRAQARAARARLSAAAKLLSAGSSTDFYAEVERALNSFLDAKLGTPVTGMTRPELMARLTEARVPEAERLRILAVYERCDLGRYAPGMGESAARAQTVEDAVAAMEGWT